MDFTGERFVPGVQGDIRLEHLHRYLLARTLVRHKRVLDIACGEGYGAALLSKSALMVTGVDIDDDSITHARKTYVGADLNFLRGDATAIPLADASVDIVVSFETLEHISDQQRMMTEIKRVLIPGGLLVMSSPDRQEYSDVPKYSNPFHVKELYRTELEDLISNHFKHSAIYGQRVQYGSIISPLSNKSVRFVGFRESVQDSAVEGNGLPKPVYFIIAASDVDLPDLPAGVFIPEKPPFLHEIDFLSSELKVHQRSLAASVETERSLRLELQQRGDRIDELATTLETERAGGRLHRLQLERRCGELEAELARAHGLCNETFALLREMRSEIAVSTERSSQVERQLAEALVLVHAMRSSTSWRLTAPIRSIRFALRRIRQSGYIGVSLAARATYRALPLPFTAKVHFKGQLFRALPRVFARTGAYARWQSETSSALEPALPRKELAAAPVANEPAVARDGQEGTVLNLPTADGRWEWVAYDRVCRGIETVRAELRAQTVLRERRMYRVDRAELFETAARGALPDPGAAPDVSVIVPVYNELATTLECLLSLQRAETECTFEVIVADDASTDGTAACLAHVRHLRLVSQPQNLGFLRNCNAASEYARGRFLVFLNNDAQVGPRWLDGLVKTFDEPDVGAVGPRMVFPNGRLQEAGVRVRRYGSVEMIGLNGDPADTRWSFQRDVEYVSGACLMIRAKVFRELGGFNDDLAPAYCEDLELCLRLRMRGLRVVYNPEAEIVHELSKTSASLEPGYKHTLIARNMQKVFERHQELIDALDDVCVIAFYLPQFYPTPENDFWWGPGFTEWRNVAKARPNFIGHDQPRQPGDLGYYDLRLRSVRDQQRALAARYGVNGFCYYYYWFDGHRMLDKPIEDLLDPTLQAHPFCLCWANENWTRRWDGQDREILIEQKHSPDDDIAVIHDIVRYMANPAYIRIRGKPLLLVYRVDLFPDFPRTAEAWRTECHRLGIGKIYLAMVQSFKLSGDSIRPHYYGCDAAVEFPAHYVPNVHSPTVPVINPAYAGHVTSYEDAAIYYATREHPGYKRFRCVMPGWDNTARMQDSGFIFEQSSPGAFQAWVEAAVAETKRDFEGDERILFVNAWNEWAEGAYLEPDRRFGHTYLEALRNGRMADWLRSDRRG